MPALRVSLLLQIAQVWDHYLELRRKDANLAIVLEMDARLAFDGEALAQLLDRVAAPDQAVKANAGRAYLEGLLWVLEMYRHGVCGDFRYSYSGKAVTAKAAATAARSRSAPWCSVTSLSCRNSYSTGRPQYM